LRYMAELCFSNVDICYRIASYLDATVLLQFQIVNSVCLMTGETLYRELRRSAINNYLSYCYRTNWDTDKKVVCRLQLNRNKQLGGIFIFGGSFDSIGAVLEWRHN